MTHKTKKVQWTKRFQITVEISSRSIWVLIEGLTPFGASDEHGFSFMQGLNSASQNSEDLTG